MKGSAPIGVFGSSAVRSSLRASSYVAKAHHTHPSPHMDLLLVAMLLATQAPEPPSGHSAMPTPGAEPGPVYTKNPAPDTEARVLLRLEDDWALGLTRRDATVFRRLLAGGFVYTEDDRTVGRDAVLHDIVAGPDTVETARNEDMKVHRFGTTAVVTGWLVVCGHGSPGHFSRRYRFTDTWVQRRGRWQIVAAHDYLVPTTQR